MDPFEGGDRVARGVMGGVQLHQGQQRIDIDDRRTDVMEELAAYEAARREAELYDRYGVRGDGLDPSPQDPASSYDAGGPGGTQVVPDVRDMPTIVGQSTRASPNLSSDTSVAGPLGSYGGGGGGPGRMGRGFVGSKPEGPQFGEAGHSIPPTGGMPTFGAGDVRNQPDVLERLQMATGGTMSRYGERPKDLYEAEQRRTQGDMLMDLYGPQLGLDPNTRALMEYTGQMPPIMQPHQREGYGSAEDMAKDAYPVNRVRPEVLAALIRANSAEAGGGLTAQRLNDIRTNRFTDAVVNYMHAERAAGREVELVDAYNEVMGSFPGGTGANVSVLDIAQAYPELSGIGDLGGVAIPPDNAPFDPEVTALVGEAMRAGNMAATLQRIAATQPHLLSAVLNQIELMQKYPWMQRAITVRDY
jgi:hypothetical protein